MQVQKTIGQLTIEFTAENHLDVFSQLSELEEVFGSVTECGKCKSKDVRFSLRKANDGKKKEFVYPEAVCKNCYAKFKFGQSEGGKLFPIKYVREDGEYVKDDKGKNIPLGTNGWTKYNKETGKDE